MPEAMTEKIHRYDARVGFCNATRETISVASGEGELTEKVAKRSWTVLAIKELSPGLQES